MKRTLGALCAMWALGCHPEPPAFWDEGGARLAIPRATLTPHEGKVIEIFPDGRVVRDGDVKYVIDRAGRVTDENYEPVALLLPSGELVGDEDEFWGRVGLRNATPPWSPVSWLRVSPKGNLLHFDERGRALHAGTWQGCEGVGLRVCTLVSQLLTLSRVRRVQPSHFYFGLGIGTWY